ncbi:hypothetical protein SPRG_14520 [Saprolegnia parasitica CBS 223.65]|uniref:Uncharacterized protein n=1 Tax=Saprolegnia parasitica (strain CBS 223.65) TaxID=695850 RepID=A0A067C073_SAPPC|nr:hypothetical protein SPRG_14520 [Saprolegnia parasitica CBS 223.65]KDO20172.1 hypothetical protein SPRG_14520 [Saprolegnia parasitica CBS 223.65]|eukprot:XP_012209121.1 hypothetical protein SPRG_14520 [Saprolegnia parasitica CBS 223.65]
MVDTATFAQALRHLELRANQLPTRRFQLLHKTARTSLDRNALDLFALCRVPSPRPPSIPASINATAFAAAPDPVLGPERPALPLRLCVLDVSGNQIKSAPRTPRDALS